jgi:hypothetical protein
MQMNVVQGLSLTLKRPPHLVVRPATNNVSRLDILTNRAMEGDLISKEGSYESLISSSKLVSRFCTHARQATTPRKQPR